MVSIKTCISTYKDMWDINGQWLPPGNYYFTITSYKDDKYSGNIYCKTLQADYTFRGLQVISMMSQSQARLIRRTSLPKVTLMPNYSSPSNSPICTYPKKMLGHKLSNTLFGDKKKCKTPPSCTICLLDLDKNKQKLECGHSFHKTCIRRWSSIKDTCPICRAKIRKKSKKRSKYVYRSAPTLPPISSSRNI